MEKKTDESVKAGLQLEGDTNPLKREQLKNSVPDDIEKEVDGDELVHEIDDVPVDTNEEQDVDDLVHSVHVEKTVRDNDEKDPDDLVHEK